MVAPFPSSIPMHELETVVPTGNYFESLLELYV